jgi:two-component system sensor histidine kinase BarA
MERTPPPAPANALDEGLRILVADDNPINQKLTRVLLEAQGVLVSTAANGYEALALAQNQAFDLILMDVHMPKMSGLEATRRIRYSNGPNVRTPIVAVTADVLPDNHRRIFTAGMNEILLKPVDEADLLATIAAYFGTSQDAAQDTALKSPAGGPAQGATTDLPVHDREAALRISGGNEEIAREMVAMLLATADEDADDIAQLAAKLAWDPLWEKVHRFAGAAAVCGVPALLDVLRRMESSVKKRDADKLHSLVAELLVQIGRLKSLHVPS